MIPRSTIADYTTLVAAPVERNGSGWKLWPTIYGRTSVHGASNPGSQSSICPRLWFIAQSID